MAWRAGRCRSLSLRSAACTPTEDRRSRRRSIRPPIRRSGSPSAASRSRAPPSTRRAWASSRRRRSEQLSQDAQAFLRSRLVAAGGSDFARATVEEASLVEQARPTNEGVLASATEPNWEMVGVLALKVAIVDGLGIEQSFASSRVEIKRTISQRASVEAKDDFARTIINDLIAASSTRARDQHRPEPGRP